eukprot:TRINITY_DN4735_c0_g1_i1.p1 TRINITY_DN4735_c0_g1~~TRINITY_DN4735_c0_g1_i1.p1  ORF type:complete len:198 (+),score=48.08 TRINITY_DN4735_c0_g1_i1:57-596(+)
MAAIMLKGLGGAGLLVALEQSVLREQVPCLYEVAQFGLPKAFAAVILVNVIGSVFLLLSLGMKVGAARTKYGVKLPKMYAEGTDENATKFNCIQRGHQQALETYPQFLMMSVIGGLFSPVVVTFCGVIYNISRRVWAEGYATGNPDSRYSSFVAVGIWYSLLAVMGASVATAVHITGCI